MSQPRVMKPATTHTGIVDCDIHVLPKTPRDILPFLPARWQSHLLEYGNHLRQPFTAGLAWPKVAPATARRDAWPPSGGPPGSDLDFIRAQHLDANNIALGIMQVLEPGGSRQRNPDYAIALARAVNDWQCANWTSREPRLKGSMIVAQEETQAAVAEIERVGSLPDFVQILFAPRCEELLGRSRYWPIYEAAVRHNLPIALHVGGANGHAATAGIGHPSYYFEEHHANVHSMQAAMTSLILDGVFEEFPGLQIVMVEAGFAWAQALGWRLDKHWERLRSEVPRVRRPPSEYIHANFWFTTQPVDEPEHPGHLRDSIDWIGADRILFSSDYPHWDFDDPRYAFRNILKGDEGAKVFGANARSLYRLNANSVSQLIDVLKT